MARRTKSDASSEDAILLEIDGPGVTPYTIDPLLTLDLGRTYLQLLKKVSEDAGIDLELRGLEIRNKCAALAFPSSNIREAEKVVDESHRILMGLRAVDRGLSGVADEFMSAVRRLPKEQEVFLVHPHKKLHVPLAPTMKAPIERSVTTLRVTVVAVSGSPLKAKLVSRSEGPKAFNVQLDRIETARLVAKHLFEQADAELELERDLEGRIVGGALLEFTTLSAERPMDAWRAWHAKVGAEWDSVEDIEQELGRSDDDGAPNHDA